MLLANRSSPTFIRSVLADGPSVKSLVKMELLAFSSINAGGLLSAFSVSYINTYFYSGTARISSFIKQYTKRPFKTPFPLYRLMAEGKI